MPTFSLVNDLPLGEGPPVAHDGLGFASHAQRVAEVVTTTPGSFTLGLDGTWGSGKTSLMRMVQADLDHRDGVVTVWFNAWRSERADTPLSLLSLTIRTALQGRPSWLAGLSDQGISLLGVLQLLGRLDSPPPAERPAREPGDTSAGTHEPVSATPASPASPSPSAPARPDPIPDRLTPDQAHAALLRHELPAGRRIVVFIDDLDRCFPDVVLAVLESVTLFLSHPAICFVIAGDHSLLETHIRNRYQNSYGIANFQGQSCLDKMVQFQFPIPRHRGSMAEFGGFLLERLPEAVRPGLSELFPFLKTMSGGHPRLALRFLNEILNDASVNRTQVAGGGMVEIPIGHLAITHCLRQLWPETLASLNRSETLCKSIAGWDRAQLRREALAVTSPTARVCVNLLLDRELLTLLQTPQGQAWLNDPRLRRAAVEFVGAQRLYRRPLEGPVRVPHDIVLSYSVDDRRNVFLIAERLSEAGLKVFMDTNVALGANWQTTMAGILPGTSAIAFCIGPTTAKSRGIQEELHSLLASRNSFPSLRIIPIILPGADWKLVPAPLREYHGIDLTTDSQSGVDQLIDALRPA